MIPLSMVSFTGNNIMLTNHNEIKAWLDSMEIENYTIHNTGTVTVDGNVYIGMREITEIPVQFRIVYGNFYCSRNKLKSLNGSPREVGGYFYCDGNRLESLEGSPREVAGNFNCANNRLKTLEGAPQEIAGSLLCWKNGFETVPKCDTIANGGIYWKTAYAN